MTRIVNPDGIQPVDLTAGRDLAEVLEPFLWLDEVTSVYGAGGLWYFDVRGFVKWRPDEPLTDPAPSGQLAAYVTARAVRQLLYGRAEAAITAVEEAGFRHDSHPRIDVDGDLMRSHDRDRLVAKAFVRMRLVPPS